MKTFQLLAFVIGAFAATVFCRAKDLSVAADGTGDFQTIQAAVDAVPADSTTRTIITIRKGTYAELVVVPREKKNLTIRGEDRQAAIIAATNNAKLNTGGRRCLFSVAGDDFVLENVTLHNTTPKGGSQAEALDVRADRVVLRHCDFKSFQDTLRLNGRVYVDECYLEGDVDFVWGDGSVYFNRCEIKALHDGYLVQSRNDAAHDGYVFVDCTLTGAPDITHYVFARIEPGRFPFSHVAFINCKVGDFLNPGGWQLDKAPNAVAIAPADHVRFWEYQSTNLAGKPLDVSRRLTVSRQITPTEAEQMRNASNVLGGWTPPTR